MSCAAWLRKRYLETFLLNTAVVVRQLKRESLADFYFLYKLDYFTHSDHHPVFHLESEMFTAANIGVPGFCVLTKKVDSKMQVDCSANSQGSPSRTTTDMLNAEYSIAVLQMVFFSSLTSNM